MAIRAIALNVIRDAIRQKILYVTVAFTLALYAVEPMMPSFNVGVRLELFQDMALSFAYVSLGIVAVALAVNQVPGEIEKRTIYNVLSKPVKRSDFLIGKYLGLLVVLAACSLLMGLAILVFAFGFFGQVAFGAMQGIWTSFLVSALLAAFAIFVSTFVTPTVNVFICLFLYFMGHAKGDAARIMLESGGISRVLGFILKYLIPSLGDFNIGEAVARGIIVAPLYMLQLFLYATLFSAVLIAGASLSLARKEV